MAISKKNKIATAILISVLLAMILCSVVLVLVFKLFNPKDDNGDFFGYDAKVLSSIPASEYKGVATLSEIERRLDELGFNDYQVSASYTMNGDFLGEDAVMEDGNDFHPTYDIQYFTESGDYWIIYIYGDQIMANPVSYNLQSSREVRVLISEKNTITSYSSKLNCFYEIIPAETELLVFKVDEINAETLESLTMEALDKL